jgi:catechol 2,3-dioxygenase-like lactoylglutathione lyase family enzyme
MRDTMKRLHVHMAVEDLQQAIDFYTVMFGAEPTRRESDYAKWQLDDPRMNFAISARGHTAGMEHLGIEFDDPAELAATQQRLGAVDGKARDQKRTTCCYAVSDKSWVEDPAGAMWEVFHTVAEAEQFGDRATERTIKNPVTGGGDPKA